MVWEIKEVDVLGHSAVYSASNGVGDTAERITTSGGVVAMGVGAAGLCTGSGCVHRRAWASPTRVEPGPVHGPPWIVIALRAWLRGRCPVRSSIDNQLRTGTDKGNPTV